MLDHWLLVRDNVLYVPLKSVNTQIFPQAQCSCPIFDVFSISLPPKLSRPLKESRRTLLELLFQPLLMLRGPPMVPLHPKGALFITCHRQQRCPMFWVSPYTALSLSNYSLSASIDYSFAFFFNELSKGFTLGLIKLLISPSCSLSVLLFSRKEMVYR